MIVDNEKRSVVLVGGPYDGYNGISVKNQDEWIRPGGHHKVIDRDCRYRKIADGIYAFAGYLN